MGTCSVLVRGPASVPRDVRRDQLEHSLSLETEHATSRDARQGKHAVARRHEAHHAGWCQNTLQQQCRNDVQLALECQQSMIPAQHRLRLTMQHAYGPRREFG